MAGRKSKPNSKSAEKWEFRFQNAWMAVLQLRFCIGIIIARLHASGQKFLAQTLSTFLSGGSGSCYNGFAIYGKEEYDEQ